MERHRFPSIPILCFFHCFLFSLVIATNSSIATDRDALLALKARISDDPSNLLVNNWSTSTSVCNWTGVSCGIRHHRVIGLDISYFGLRGTIPPQFGNLSFLSMLDIENNSFHGSLPLELSQLRRLRYIGFGNNDFRNENIPSWFGSLPKLTDLYLYGNGFIGTISSLSLNNISSILQNLGLSQNQLSGTIPSSIFNNVSSSLEFINLGGNQLSGTIPSSIINNNRSSLELIDLSDNQLSGSFPSISVKLSSLLTIDFSNNGLSGELPKDIFSYLPNLKFLYLSSNMFRGEIPFIALSEYCKNLQELSLSFNNFTGVIPKEIGNLTKLKELYLGINQLQRELPRELGNIAELEVLSLREIGLTGTIPKEIGNLTKLNFMDFRENNLQGEIPSAIGNLLNLEFFELSFNNLAGVIPPSIFNISTIKMLALQFNQFSGILPSSIGLGLPNLEELYLFSNNFSGVIPNSITNASKLSILEMASNSFSGFIPNTFGNLRGLTWLNLGSNYLKPSTPHLSFLSSIADCKHLEGLSLYENPLNGILPSSIGNLSFSLGAFKMQDCNISGIIPEEISNLRNLILLDMSDNELSGSIPITLSKLQKLQALSLANNKLEGSIPDNLCHLNQLDGLYLPFNKLSGSIPACLGNLAALRSLDLSFNNLTSVVPSTLWNLKDILHVDLSSNSLNGDLPPDIGNLKVLIDLDLSRNHLSGGIPTTIGGLNNLQLLNLSYNRLQDPIPTTFGDLISVESLDLSSNNLSGVIPKSMESLFLLKYINLSFNRLEGEIPTGGSFVNFSAKSFLGNRALCGSPQLQVPPCKVSTHQKSSSTILLLILLPIGIVALIIILTFLYLFRRSKRKSRRLPTDIEMSPQATWRRISYLELMQATNGFNESNLLGTGGFGSVYKGLLQDDIYIAVKVFHMHLEGAIKSFDVECEVMSSIRHRNLVKIISSCTNDDFKALVLEYMPNGSLEKHLYSDNYFLDILQRLNITIDVALALEYLHFGNSTPIVHCDVKPSNVLLDENMVAHLSDFGIAKLFGGEESMMQTQTLATIGYMAPEYGREGKVSRKGDVYSFGIMLIEAFTRKKPTDDMFVGEMNLRGWVDDSVRANSAIKVADTTLLRKGDTHFRAKELCVSSVLQLALDCTTNLPEHRINIKSVVSRLVKIRASLVAKTKGVIFVH